MEKIIWSAPEYEEKNHNNDWFWALGVIVVTASLAAIIYGNYFFAALIIISGALLGYLATKKPRMVSYELNEKGFRVHTALYPYENIKSFWVQKAALDPEVLKPMLFIKSERFFMPVISSPIENIMAEDIRGMLLEKNILEEEMREHVSEKIMEALGF
jgi:hypothetical protein